MEQYSRNIPFESILNFRDIGGYPARDGRSVIWRRVFRSALLIDASQRDLFKLNHEIGLKSAIDLSNPTDSRQQQEITALKEIGVKYYHVPFRPSSNFTSEMATKLYPEYTNMGEVYLYRVRHKIFGQRLVEALKIIAESKNHPLVFHCGAGKDRSGILAAFVLSLLGVSDQDIIGDYILTSPFMEEIRNQINNDPETPEDIKNLPEYTWKADPESMELFLSTLKQEYGSITDYLYAQGAESSLIQRLEDALLT